MARRLASIRSPTFGRLSSSAFGVVRKRPSVVIPHWRSSASRLCQPCILVPDSISTSIGAEFGRASKVGRSPNRLMSSSRLSSRAPYAKPIWRTRSGVNPKLAPTSAALFPLRSARIICLFLFVLRWGTVSPPLHKYRYSTFFISIHRARNPRIGDQHALAAPHSFVQFPCGKVAFVQDAPPAAIPSRKRPPRTKSC
jgi:hypothetical protein